MNKPVKLLLTWNVRPGREEAYLEFVTQEFPESMLEADLQPTEAWYTVYGEWPEVTMGFMVESLEKLQDFLTSRTWYKLRRKLNTYIQDYHQKAIPLRRGYQI
ncbi:MAG: hypothetical protein ACP5HM_09640 [Anaerolineae bacterium]